MNFCTLQKVGLALTLAVLTSGTAYAADAGQKNESTNTSKGTSTRALVVKEQKAMAKDTAKIKEQIKDPDALPPIKGFHPIKKLWRPIDKMNNTVGQLQTQVNRLQKPINVLTPPMVGLQGNMTAVDQRIGALEGQLTDLHQKVSSVRGDLKTTQKSISTLRGPLVELKQPMENIAGPISSLDAQLNWIIAAIVMAAGGIAFGAPLAAFLIFLNRYRLFPAFFAKRASGASTHGAAAIH